MVIRVPRIGCRELWTIVTTGGDMCHIAIGVVWTRGGTGVAGVAGATGAVHAGAATEGGDTRRRAIGRGAALGAEWIRRQRVARGLVGAIALSGRDAWRRWTATVVSSRQRMDDSCPSACREATVRGFRCPNYGKKYESWAFVWAINWTLFLT